MTATKNFVTTLAVSATMSIGTVMFAIPAMSTPNSTLTVCDAGNTCGYDGGVNHDGGSYTGLLDYGPAGQNLQNMVAGIRNKLSSWKNNSGTNAAFYYNTGGLGTCVPMYSHDQASASSSNPDDDQAESWRFNRLC